MNKAMRITPKQITAYEKKAERVIAATKEVMDFSLLDQIMYELRRHQRWVYSRKAGPMKTYMAKAKEGTAFYILNPKHHLYGERFVKLPPGKARFGSKYLFQSEVYSQYPVTLMPSTALRVRLVKECDLPAEVRPQIALARARKMMLPKQ